MWMIKIFLVVMLFILTATLRQRHSGSCKTYQRSFAYDPRVVSAVANIPSGILAIHKPKDWTSNDVVQKIKNVLRQGGGISAKKVKVGHGGTLDPIAEGVLVVGVGEGTKLMQQYLSGSKIYRAVGKLGIATDTLDNTGEVIETKSCEHVNADMLLRTIPKFRGNITQIPPMYSALKQDGVRLYDLARKGKVVPREARPVTVYGLEMINDENFPLPNFITLQVECSGGFYVRTLIEDIAVDMNTVGHMVELTRVKQGIFTLDDCLKQNEWCFEKIVDKLHQFASNSHKIE